MITFQFCGENLAILTIARDETAEVTVSLENIRIHAMSSVDAGHTMKNY